MIGLIGEGQEIHLGEEAGIAQWNDAISYSEKNWIVSCPLKLKQYFKNAANIYNYDELNLTKSLRSHLAEDLQFWINYVLEGNYQDAKALANELKDNRFDIYITRKLENAKQYVITRYFDEVDKRYGLLASSKDKALPKYGINNDFMSTRNVKKGPWYIAERDDRNSCCQLKDVMTEFGCQGLELDFPIVCWGNDFIRISNNWKDTQFTRGAKDNFLLRKNSYRVLLSRGRDGMILFIPEENIFDDTFQFLLESGLKGRII